MLKRSLLTLAIPALLAWGSMPATASAGKYLVTVVGAQLAPKKSKYKRWDTGFGRMPLPDPYLIMEVAGKRFTTPILSNTITPKWNVSWKVQLTGTERLYFVLKDKDLGSDDLIAKGNVLLSKANTPFGFGRVTKLTLKVERLDPPKPVVRRIAPVRPVARPVARPVTKRPRCKARCATRCQTRCKARCQACHKTTCSKTCCSTCRKARGSTCRKACCKANRATCRKARCQARCQTRCQARCQTCNSPPGSETHHKTGSGSQGACGS